MKITSQLYKLLIGIWRITPGKRQLARLIKLSEFLVSKFYRDLKFSGPFEISIPNGRRLKLFHFGGSAENDAFWFGALNGYDIDTRWFWFEISPKCEVLFDIGANIGLYGLVAKCLNSSITVHAFEPARKTFKQLKTNVNLNGFEIITNQLALSSTTGTATFFDVNTEIQYSASLSPDKLPDDNRVTYQVQTMTLSDYIDWKSIDQLDLMKIDVELFEPEVIRGFADKLTTLKPIVIIEILTDKVAQQLNELIDTNHLIYRFRPDQTLVEIPRFKFEPYEYNFLFFHKDRLTFVQENTSIAKRLISQPENEK